MKTGTKRERIYTRSIKFLAWHIRKQKMYTVSRIDFLPDGTRTISVVEKPGVVIPDGEVELLPYTNLNDKHEKEIYEGWMVRDPKTGQIYEVLYRADRYMVERRRMESESPGYELSDLYPLNEDVEVIGNIFEHPDLLKKVGYDPLYENMYVEEDNELKN